MTAREVQCKLEQVALYLRLISCEHERLTSHLTGVVVLTVQKGALPPKNAWWDKHLRMLVFAEGRPT